MTALADLSPYPRGAPPRLPFEWSAHTLRSGLNVKLVTDLGDIDLFGEVAGGGRFERLLEDSIDVEIFGLRCRCVSLDQLVHLKRAAGRPRDYETIAELEIIRAEQEQKP